MSEVGLRVRRSDGYVETTVTTRLTKIIGSHSIPLFNAIASGSGAALRYRAPAAANGGIVVNDFMGGSPFFYFRSNGQQSFYGLLVPAVSISGNSLTWTWVDSAVNQKVRAELINQATAGVNCVGGVTLVYGVYS